MLEANLMGKAIANTGLPNIDNATTTGATGLGYSFHNDSVKWGNLLYWVGTYDGATFYQFDGTTWTNLGGLPGRRYGHVSAVVGDFLYVCQGYVNGGVSGAMWRYDLVNKVWKTDLAVCPSPSRFGDGVVIGKKIYYFGGMISGSADETPATFYQTCYDTETNTWTTLNGTSVGGTISGRVAAGAVTYNDKAYIIGGRYNGVYKDEVWVYDPIANTYTLQTAKVPTPLVVRRCVQMYRGWMVTLMGMTNGGGSISQCYKMDPSKPELGWSLWTNPGAGLRRAFGGSGVLGNVAYMFSGIDGTTGRSDNIKITT